MKNNPQKQKVRSDPVALVLRGLIHVYRYTLSYLLGRQCRHAPTCSEYALVAIDRFGSWRGGWLALSRICRCHPWGSHGFDPVPERLDVTYKFWHGWKYGRWSPQQAMRLAVAEATEHNSACGCGAEPEDKKKDDQ